MSYARGGIRGRIAVVHLAAAALVLATGASLLSAPTPVTPVARAADANATGDLRAQIAALRTQADRATARLRTQARAYENARQRLSGLQRRTLTAVAAEQDAEDRVTDARSRLTAFAVATYESPIGDDLGALLDDPLRSVDRQRSVTDVTYVAADRGRTAAAYTAELNRRAAVRTHLATMKRRAAAAERDLAARHRRLAAESAQLSGRLLKRLDQLTVRLARQGAYAAALKVSRERLARSGEDTGECDKPPARGFPNGLIPVALLCPLPDRGEMLRSDAARAFWLLDALYRARFGRHICVTDSYRPLAEQYAVFRTKPGLAASPGTSRHGLGVALDLGCGIQVFGSTQFRWMKANAPRYGWVHPYWAEHSPFEPWHWEYGNAR